MSHSHIHQELIQLLNENGTAFNCERKNIASVVVAPLDHSAFSETDELPETYPTGM